MGMRPEDLDKWIAALRSGRYGQATGLLQDIDEDGYASNAYCCLGVLDTALGVNYEDEGLVKDDMERSRTNVPCGLLPTCQDVLAHINDDWRFEFPQIAAMLEANRESLIAVGSFPRDWWADHAHHIPERMRQLSIRELELEAIPG